MSQIKLFIKRIFYQAGINISFIKPKTSKRISNQITKRIPNADLYKPLFSPWIEKGNNDFSQLMKKVSNNTLVSVERCYVLYILGSQCLFLNGVFFECGVYKGGTALLLAGILDQADFRNKKKLFLFDTFEGMPETDSEKDLHKQGDFSDTSLEAVKSYVGHPEITFFVKGLIPDSFTGMEDLVISFAHIDVDIYSSVIECCRFIYPRMEKGGIMIFDDYGFPSCPGAREAVDLYFKDKPEFPLVLSTGQALVFKI